MLIQLTFLTHLGAVDMGEGTGHLPGQDVKRDSPCMCISLICSIPFMEISLPDFFRPVQAKRRPVRSTEITAKVGQFISNRTPVPLCQDDITLTFQIVLGEIVLGKWSWVKVFSYKRGMKGVPTR